MHMCAYVCIPMCMCACACAYACVRVYDCVCTFANMHVPICICICMCVYTCVSACVRLPVRSICPETWLCAAGASDTLDLTEPDPPTKQPAPKKAERLHYLARNRSIIHNCVVYLLFSCSAQHSVGKSPLLPIECVVRTNITYCSCLPCI